jgi:hypothetical protein
MSLKSILLWAFVGLNGVGLLFNGLLRDEFYTQFSYCKCIYMYSLYFQHEGNSGSGWDHENCCEFAHAFVFGQFLQENSFEIYSLDRLYHLHHHFESEKCGKYNKQKFHRYLSFASQHCYYFLLHGLSHLWDNIDLN